MLSCVRQKQHTPGRGDCGGAIMVSQNEQGGRTSLACPPFTCARSCFTSRPDDAQVLKESQSRGRLTIG